MTEKTPGCLTRRSIVDGFPKAEILERIAGGDKVLIVAPLMTAARELFDVLAAEAPEDARITRTNGGQRIWSPAGGVVSFTSALAIRVHGAGRGLELNAAYAVYVDLDDEHLEMLMPALYANAGELVDVQAP